MTATSTLPRAEPRRATSSGVRRIVGSIRLAASALILVAIVTQVTDLVLHDAFSPEEYFSYFTIQSNLMNVVVLAVGGVVCVRWRDDPRLLTQIRMSVLAYAVVTGVVYNVLLRGHPDGSYAGPQWPNEVMHVWIPIVILLDWILAPGRAALPWRSLWIAVSYPIAWVAFTLVRGAITGWYPYPFLIPDAEHGYGIVSGYVVGIAAFIVLIASGAIALSRVGSRRRDHALTT